MTYYNTNHEEGDRLRRSENNTRSQEEVILEHFEQNPTMLLTAEDCHRILLSDCPITSVRRAVTNLMKEGELNKTTHMKTGMYGKDIHCYRYAGGPQMELWA